MTESTISPAALEKAQLLKQLMEDELNRQNTAHLTAFSTSKREDEFATNWGTLEAPNDLVQTERLAVLTSNGHAPILDEGIWAVCARAHRNAPTEKWQVNVQLLDAAVRERLVARRQKLDLEVEKEFRRFAEGKAWSRVALSWYPSKGPAEVIVDTGGAAVEKHPLTEKLAQLLERVIALYAEEGLKLRVVKWTLKKKMAFDDYFS